MLTLCEAGGYQTSPLSAGLEDYRLRNCSVALEPSSLTLVLDEAKMFVSDNIDIQEGKEFWSPPKRKKTMFYTEQNQERQSSNLISVAVTLQTSEQNWDGKSHALMSHQASAGMCRECQGHWENGR